MTFEKKKLYFWTIVLVFLIILVQCKWSLRVSITLFPWKKLTALYMVKTLVLSMALLIINEPLLIMNVNICDVAEAKQHLCFLASATSHKLIEKN